MLIGHFSWLSFTKSSSRLEFQERLDHAMYPHAIHQPPLDPGQDCMNSLTVPCVLLLGNADMDQAPILPGSMDKSAAVFRMHCLLVGLLRKRHRTEATQKPFKEEKSPDGTSTSALFIQLLALTPTIKSFNSWFNQTYYRGLLHMEPCAGCREWRSARHGPSHLCPEKLMFPAERC